MGMPVMDVGKVRVRVSDRRMLMRMRVRLFTVPIKIMRMLVVLVVPVSMVMVQNLVSVRMFMPLTDMKPDSQSHERRGNPERQRWHFGPEEKR